MKLTCSRGEDGQVAEVSATCAGPAFSGAATGGCASDDRAKVDVEDEACEEGISKRGWSEGKKRESRHIGRDGLGDVADEVFVSVLSKHVKFKLMVVVRDVSTPAHVTGKVHIGINVGPG